MKRIRKKNKYTQSIFLIIALFSVKNSICNADVADSLIFPPPPGLINEFEKLIEEQSIPGVAIGLINKGEQQFIGLGGISFTNSTKPSLETRYEIGSVSKLFTSLLAQTLVDKKLLSWGDRLADHIDGKFSSLEVSQIQLRELATHRSGLPKLPENRPLFRDWSDPYNEYTHDDLYDELRGKKVGTILSRMFTQPRLDKSYTYSNLGAGLLGQIVADQLNTNYATALSNEVLKPLSLHCTDLTDAPPLAPGHEDDEVVKNWHFQSLAGAGAIRSCMQDMLKFATAILASFDDSLHPADKKTNNSLRKSIATTIETHAHKPDVGLAWFISHLEGRDIWWHNGGTGGYTSIILIEPKAAHALILLVNSNLYKKVTKIGFKAMRAW